MKKYTIFILIVLLLSLYSNAFAYDYIGKRLYLYGDSAQALGRGGTGIASFGFDLLYMNPASIARMERFGIGAQYGTLDGGYYNPNLTFAVPTSYGVFGAVLRYYNIPQSKDFNSAYSIQFGGAKDFTDNLMLGMTLNFVYAKTSHDLFYVGATIGAIYKFKGTRHKKGLCVYQPNLGFAVNGGGPIGENHYSVNFNSFTIGYSFQFLRYDNIFLGFFNDLSIFAGDSNSPLKTVIDFPIKFGLEATIFKNYIIRAGTTYPHAYRYGVFSVGLGYNFNSPTLGLSVNYSLNYYQEQEMIHNVSLNFEYGKLDRDPPKTTIRPDSKYFSPNYDGNQDYTLFNVSASDDSRIKGWKLQILDDRKNVIKEYKMSERDMTKGLTFAGFFKRFFQKKESMVIPESIMWDGTNKNGKVIPDGKYTYTFTAWDARDNIARKKSGVIILDNTGPNIELETSENLFSPNGDQRKDILVIHQQVKTSPDDEWTASFADSDGKVVRSYSWNGNDVPAKIIWDGKDENGEDAPEGLYYYTISSKDKAGNTAHDDIREITLTRQYEIADVRLSKEYFSFEKDTDINLFTKLSKSSGLEEWKIIITDSHDKVVNELVFKDSFKSLVTWDCKDEKGEKLPDGEYYIRLLTLFKSGNRPESFKKKLIIDSTPPALKVSHDPDLFSPDGDGENDILTIQPRARDNLFIEKWTLNIYAPSGDLFKSFSGNGDVPDEMKWDGYSDSRDLVESAADYYIELVAEDIAGNIAKSEKDTLHIDILVVVTERGLKMRISNIEFGFGSSKIMKKGKGILNRVRDILKRYDKYNIVIEGHTDDIGREDYNLKLSEIRAQAVREYLIEKGIDEDRVKFVGIGEMVPLYPNTNKENRRRNRRVEFLLIKKDKNVNENIDNEENGSNVKVEDKEEVQPAPESTN